MDIAGYVFLALVLGALILGLAKGFTNALFGLLTAVGSIGVALVFTPTVCQLDLVKKLIEDTPVVINGTEMYFLRTVIVFFALFVAALVVLLAIKGLFIAILKRVKLLKVLDRLLGVAFNVAIVWAIFGILFATGGAGSDWLVKIDEQLASNNIHLGLAGAFDSLLTALNASPILQSVYGSFNPIGDLVGSILFG